MEHGEEAVLILRAAGACIAIDARQPVPTVLHWGQDIGEVDRATAAALRLTAVPALLNNAPDTPRTFTVWPTERDGWSGTPAQSGNVGGTATTPRPQLQDSRIDIDPAGGGSIVLRMLDDISELISEVRYTLDPWGVLTVDMSIERISTRAVVSEHEHYVLDGLRTLMPLPERAQDILDFTGKWCRERSPQRTRRGDGTHSRRARRGKPGHDSPYLMAVGTDGFSFGSGEVWAVHLAWSGDSEYLVETLPEGSGAFSGALGAGELLRSAEVTLAYEDTYRAPTAVFVWSGSGLDGIAQRLHQRLRARPMHPASARPLVLNTWEAVYFDHDPARLSQLVDLAVDVGVERIVLDDGWFLGRRDATKGLGDWFVDDDVWPDGLTPFVDEVHRRGMQFGLWFEPEMINLDSELAVRHPDWILGPHQGLGPSWRDQYVLDISRPDVFDFLLDRISTLVSEHGLDFLKWDHNRDLLEPVGRRPGGDRPLVHDQTLAFYRLLDTLRERHPALEIESCSAGGGRVDLGVLQRTDRIWASDCNDPVERARLERWTRVLLPPELIGSHLGASRSHTTSRVTDLSFRLAIALTAHAGIEMDLATTTEDERSVLTAWSRLYRELRPLIHSGTVFNADLADDAVMLTGIVAPDGARALFTWVRLATSPAGQSGRVRFPGLDPAGRYRVRIRDEVGHASRHEVADPEWLASAAGDGVVIPGAVLATTGVPMPTLNPQQALLLDLERVS